MGEKKPPSGGHRHGGNANEHAALSHPSGRGATGCQYSPVGAADDRARARDALFSMSPDCPRPDWVRKGQAAHAAGLSFEDFDQWSAGGATYDPRAVHDTWHSFRADGGIGPGTLFYLAKAEGNWRPDPNAPRPPPPTPAELAQRAAVIAAAEAERKRKSAIPVDPDFTPAAIWARCLPATADYSYIVAKNGRPDGLRVVPDGDCLRQMRESLAGWLVVPVSRDGTLITLQFIAPTDVAARLKAAGKPSKLNLYRHPIDGCFIVGECPPGGVAYIVEGIGAGWAAHQATGNAAIVAFGWGNVRSEAQAQRDRDPTARLVLVPDVGKEDEARVIARELGAAVAALPDGWPKNSDIGDYAQREGVDALRALLMAATGDAPAPADPGAADPTAPTDPAAERPRDADGAGAFRLPQVCSYGDGSFIVRDDGVYYSPPDDKKGNALPDIRICDPLHVVAQTRDAAGSEWGRLLEWVTPDGQPERWAVPLELLQGDGGDVRRELSRRGLAIATGRAARELLGAYIQAWPVEARARCVDRLGWLGGAYVLPDEVIGTADGGEEVVFQGRAGAEAAHAVAGTVDDWLTTVAALAAGNSRLVFAIAAGLAGPLLHVLAGESGGFHLRGRSSSGKSTALRVGASVWGGPDFVRPWRATASGLEGVAVLHNDCVLLLDELSECDPRQVGETVYMLANGRGKARASTTGTARPTACWRLLFMSTGELSLEAQIATTGRRIAAGQEVRLADIEADAGAGMGIFEELNGHPSPAALALALKDAAARYHGAVGVAWLRWLVANRPDADKWRAAVDRFAADVVPAGASGQAGRVARRFGLVAVAGELATDAGLTGWQADESKRAAKSCFGAWLAGFGGAADREERAILEQVREFFERHADRFQELNHEHAVRNRAGFYRNTDGVRQYLVLPGVFKNEVCAGLDQRTVGRVLRAHGWIEPDAHGKSSQALHPIGLSSTRLYVFTQAMWSFEHG
nr:J284 [uncultured bacterium]